MAHCAAACAGPLARAAAAAKHTFLACSTGNVVCSWLADCCLPCPPPPPPPPHARAQVTPCAFKDPQGGLWPALLLQHSPMAPAQVFSAFTVRSVAADSVSSSVAVFDLSGNVLYQNRSCVDYMVSACGQKHHTRCVSSAPARSLQQDGAARVRVALTQNAFSFPCW